MSELYIIRRPGGVFHRATLRRLGHVAKRSGGTPHDGMWSAFGPWDDAARGEEVATRHEAALILLEPMRPLIYQQVCRECRNRMPRPSVCATGKCETVEQAVQRERRTNPDEWKHYDWLREQARTVV